MIKIRIKNAKNGIIKTIIDDNYNGADEDSPYKETIVYDTGLNEDAPVVFLKDLLEDLGIDSGSEYSNNKINITMNEWGSEYQPTKAEAALKIKELKDEIKWLSQFK